MDFKIGEDIEEEKAKKKSMPNGVKMVIIIVVSLIAGVTVFFISNHFFGKKAEVPVTTQTVSLTDPEVQQAYSYVTYGPLGKRSNKFVENISVSANTLTTADKFMYAFQLSSSSDFIQTGNKDEKGNVIYSIPNDKVKDYMSEVFGDGISYSTTEPVELILDYNLSNNNDIVLTYDSQSDSFLTTFKGLKEKENTLVDPYISALTKASKTTDDALQLEEKVVYTNLLKNAEDNYTLNIYKDFTKTTLLNSKSNLTTTNLSQLEMNINDYYQTATTIKYEFKKGTQGYYFVSSSMTVQ